MSSFLFIISSRSFFLCCCGLVTSVMSDCDPMDCSLPGSSVHGILQARILEWVAMPFSRESPWPRDGTWVSCIADRFFTIEPLRKLMKVKVTRLCPTLGNPMDYTIHEIFQWSILSLHLLGRSAAFYPVKCSLSVDTLSSLVFQDTTLSCLLSTLLDASSPSFLLLPPPPTDI